MNPLDMLIAVISVFCLVRGLFRGLVKEISSIIGAFAGYYGSYTYYSVMADFLSQWLQNRVYVNIISFIVIFFSVLIGISLLGILIKYILDLAYLGWVDRICGLGFGAMKGILIVTVLIICLTTFLPKGPFLIQDSALAPYVSVVSEKMIKVVPDDMKDEFAVKLEELRKAWKTP